MSVIRTSIVGYKNIFLLLLSFIRTSIVGYKNMSEITKLVVYE